MASDGAVSYAAELMLELAVWRLPVAHKGIPVTALEVRLPKVLTWSAGKSVFHKELLQADCGLKEITDSGDTRLSVTMLKRSTERTPSRLRNLLTEQERGYRLACR